jgi:uncharacterized membrane protein
MNNSNIVVGTLISHKGRSKIMAGIYDGSTFHALPKVRVLKWSDAFSINNYGMIVGSIEIKPREYHIVCWKNGIFKDLARIIHE